MDPSQAEEPISTVTGERAGERADERDEITQRCLNCDTVLRGAFCHRCGQEDRDLGTPFRQMAHEWLGSFFAFDSRVLRTLEPLILRPGWLTREYLSGRRVRYVPPLRLYFFFSILMLLALAWSDYTVIREATTTETGGTAFSLGIGRSSGDPENDDEESLDAEPTSTPTTTSLSSAFVSVLLEPYQQDPEALGNDFRGWLAQSLFLLVPVFALYLGLLQRRPPRPYFHHLIFSLHLHSFAFLVLFLALALEQALGSGRSGLLSTILYWWVLVYIFVALRKVYGNGWLSAFVKLALLYVIHALTLVIAIVATLVVTLILKV